jgi:hypothetical protein
VEFEGSHAAVKRVRSLRCRMNGCLSKKPQRQMFKCTLRTALEAQVPVAGDVRTPRECATAVVCVVAAGDDDDEFNYDDAPSTAPRGLVQSAKQRAAERKAIEKKQVCAAAACGVAVLLVSSSSSPPSSP